MTNHELLTKAIEWLHKQEQDPNWPELLRHVTVDRLPNRSIRDAVSISFSSAEDRGKIQVVLDRETGAFIAGSHTPPGQGT
jgi:hypothetical protein